MPEAMTIGVDIGGTKVAAGLVDSHGNISHKIRVPMVANGDAAAGFASVQNAVEALFREAPDARGSVKGIGLCSPGPLDPVRHRAEISWSFGLEALVEMR